jgi:hypothetical protein
VTNKGVKSAGLEFWNNFFLLKIRIFIGLILLLLSVGCILIDYYYPKIFLMPIAIILLINAMPGIYCFLFGWFNRVKIKSDNLFDFDLIFKYNNIRQKYGYSQL